MAQADQAHKKLCEAALESAAPSGLPLPDPFPEYVECPHCAEPEVEVWCYQTRVQCHACGEWIAHTPPVCFGSSEKCHAHEL